ncbi:MAG: histidine triad nucleotide-binding protein [Negativicutes bacterium]|nr:histidine triad nucleotide-binding protein [Negativicutes bacterium]
MSCIFCDIAAGRVEGRIVYEDEMCIAFADINPVAPVHLLLIPRQHMDNILLAAEKFPEILAHIAQTAPRLAEQFDLADDGFRIVVNTRDNGGQTVNHLHWHIIGGRFMKWPPG